MLLLITIGLKIFCNDQYSKFAIECSDITNKIQKVEYLLSQQTDILDKILEKETKLEKKISVIRKRLFEMIVYFRAISVPIHFFLFSEKTIHSAIIAKKIFPYMNKKFNSIIRSLHHLTKIKEMIIEHESVIEDLRKKSYLLRDQLNSINEVKNIKKIKNPPVFSKKFDIKNIINAWDGLFYKNDPVFSHQSGSIIKFLESPKIPVYNGEIENGCIGHVCPSEKKDSYVLKLKTYRNALISAPEYGLVAYIDQGIVVYKTRKNYIILVGVGKVFAVIGQIFYKGEAIAQMPKENTRLLIKVMDSKKTINPFVFFNTIEEPSE